MKMVFSLQYRFLAATLVLPLLSFASSSINEIEKYELINNTRESYIYCDKHRSKMAEVVEQISQFDKDRNSPLWQLHRHINDGFSIGRKDAIVEALMHAEKILNEVYRKLNSNQIEQLNTTLNSVVDAVTNGQLVVDLPSLLESITKNSSEEEQNISRRCDTIKIREKLYVLNSAKFFKDVEFKDDVTFKDDVKFKDDVLFEDNVVIEGTLTVAEEVVDCDLTVGCNINMNDSSSAAVGNINKNGIPFMSNFGINNTFLGSGAGNFVVTGINNTGVGTAALTSNTGGSYNTASGLAALASNQNGSVNTANGALSLLSNLSGSANVAVGFVSLISNQTGSANTAVGLASLASNVSGDANTSVGIGALNTNVSGSNNVAVGSGALDSSTGSNNIAIGTNAGDLLVTGNDNVYIAHPGTANETGFIRIGTLLTQIETYIQGIFGSAVGLGGLPVEVDATGKLGTVVSSAEFKENISNMGMDSAKIYDLNPVVFSYKNDNKKDMHYGLIAQEVAEVFPSLVVYDANNQPFAVRYQVLPVLLLNEVQKHQASIEALNNRVAQLEARA